MRHLLLVVTILWLTACTSLEMYHKFDGENHMLSEPDVKANEQCKPEENKKALQFGFIEFDEFGNLMDPASFDQLMKEIHAINEPVLLVSYTHGWKHSGDPDDDDVKEFKTAMRNIASMDGCVKRRVIGVYTAWRGGVTNIPLLKELTFWDRKNTAHAVGGGAMTEVLLRLEMERNWRNAAMVKGAMHEQSRMIYIGHSFGTAVLYSALAPIMVERFMHESNFGVEGDSKAATCQPQTVGDLVILLNPAFEAMRFSSLFKLSSKCSYTQGQPVILAVVTGKNDTATGWAFPVARGGRAAFQTYWKGNDIGYAANTIALGHYAGYITHNLTSIDTKESLADVGTSQAAEECDFPYEDPVNAVPQKTTKLNEATNTEYYHFNGFDLKLKPTASHIPYSPILNVSGDSKIINHHGGIYGCKLMSFIGMLINDGAPALKVTESPARQGQQ